jgi:hypothetical protein
MIVTLTAGFLRTATARESEDKERAHPRKDRGVPNPHGHLGQRAEGYVLGRLPRLGGFGEMDAR